MIQDFVFTNFFDKDQFARKKREETYNEVNLLVAFSSRLNTVERQTNQKQRS